MFSSFNMRITQPAIAVCVSLCSLVLLISLPAAADDVPAVDFGGRRFAVGRGAEAFESIAFDPVDTLVASRGKIRNQCGDEISDGPDENPGLAWDAVTGTYWQITNDRTVRRWQGATVVDTVFVIPQTFEVPISGPDTLEAVRGIAVDPTYVYVVDAGPNPGQIPSNEWFKFTRAGDPVKSSKSTAMVSHLQMNPDCLFDDVLFVPPGSPVYAGKFLVPLEHTGLVVLDDQGEYVDALYWQDQPAYLPAKPFAFTGMAIDPAAGTFYLADNDQGAAQVWTMLPEGNPTSYIIGTGSSQAYLQ